MTKQPEALRLADELDLSVLSVCVRAAAELRRLHEVNEGLMEQNTELDKKLSEWVSLTEEDFWELAPVWFERETSLIDFVAMVEAKLKEKNR